jgi:type VI secretion system protein ImpE
VNAVELFRAGRLQEAIDTLGVELRSQPADAQRRSFLFELLCFAGEYDRAEKHLDVLAGAGKEAAMGALLYRGALHASRVRDEQFASGTPGGGARPSDRVSGTINGTPFTRLSDADPRIGARLEVFAAGQYMWIPFEHIASIHVEPPKLLRELLWTPCRLTTGPGFRGVELGEVLLPALTPRAWEDEDDQVRLGRQTDWVKLDTGDVVPVGGKVLVADETEYSILDIREILVTPAAAPAA